MRPAIHSIHLGESIRLGRSGRRRAALVASAALVVAAIGPLAGAGSAVAGAAPVAGAVPVAGVATADAAGQRDVIANLFEWNWPSIGKECQSVLGPAGYGGVQVAPPQDSVKRTALGNGSDTILHPWWEVYQPVDYGLTSRMGSEAQFKTMVTACRGAGVKVYVDAVINHMTGQGDTSYGGVDFTKYNYPGVYTQANFHQKGTDCPSADGVIDDFNNLIQVRKCELSSLADLRTETPAVQVTLAKYLNKLIGYGVSGFRVDAAKHIGQPDLAAIEARLHRTADGTKPYMALEVFGGSPGSLSPFAFQDVGSVLGLDADVQIKNAFKSYPTDATGSIATLKDFGVESGLVPGSHSLTFVQNHDTERNGDALSYKDGATNTLANEFVLGYGYGRSEVYSSFAWTTSDDSPPSDANGLITATDCSSSAWVCVDRDQGITGMVGWHNQVAAAPVSNWWDNGQNLIAFSRGSKGWIALNNDPTAHTHRFTTGLAAGTYCDIIHGVVSHEIHAATTCSGPTVKVAARGQATVTVPAKDSIAFTPADRLG